MINSFLLYLLGNIFGELTELPDNNVVLALVYEAI